VAVDIWSLVHPERAAIADDVDGLETAAWQTRSLCPDWSVGQVFAHITTAAMMTPPRFLAAFASAGFKFNAYADNQIAKYYHDSPAPAVAFLRSNIDRTTAPPGPKPTWVGEIVVHSEDIRRPLGIAHEYDPAAVRTAADFYTGSNVLIGSRDRIRGVRLEATDQDWSHGEGPTARGPLLAVVMAMTGRHTFLDDLEGDGVDVLRGRS
jgi:uncharacterized protein (TIGR03083 family)